MSGSAIHEDFTRYSNSLSQRYDKHEQIYKLSRDLTRESKKIICILHRLPGSLAEEQSCVMTESEKLLAQLRDGIISDIATLLLDEPFHVFTQAYSSGMEEYIEALLFYFFLQRGSVLNYSETWQYLLHSPGLKKHCFKASVVNLNSNLEHCNTASVPRCPVCCREEERFLGSTHTSSQVLTSPPLLPSVTESGEGTPPTRNLQSQNILVPCIHQSWLQLLPHDVFILGLSDVSGELMRYCIKSVAVGELEQQDRVVKCLRQMNAGYVALGPHTSKYLSNKIYVHTRNLSKVENANYDLRLRGSELTPAQLKDDLLRRPLPDDDDQATLFP